MLQWTMLAALCLPGAGPTAYDPGPGPAAVGDGELEPGDIVLFQTDNPATRILTRVSLFGWATHTAVIVAGRDGRPMVFEANVAKSVALHPVGERLGAYGGRLQVRRRIVPLTPGQSARLTAFACAEVGKGYDYVGAGLLPFSRPTRLARPGEATMPASSRWFCSSLAVAGFVHAGLLDPTVVNADGTSAGDLMDDDHLDLSCGWYRPVPLLRCRDSEPSR